MFKKRFGISPALAAANLVLVSGSFVWYYLAFNVLLALTDSFENAPNASLTILGVNIGAILVSALVGTFIVGKSRREKLLVPWMLGGIFVSAIPLLFVPSTIFELTAISALFGAYFGIGMPATMGYFSASTSYENRARLGGILFLAIALSFFVFGSLASDNVVASSIILASIRITGLILFNWTKKKSPPLKQMKQSSYLQIFANKSVLLFLIPWLVFNIVNYMTIPAMSTLSDGYEYVRSVALIENIFIAVFALITGFLADSIGRKRLAILGFAMLGVGYAAVTFSAEYGWYVYTVADGIAWGIFNVLFLFTLWGDLAQGQNSEKFYVVGALPYLSSNFMRLLMEPLVSSLGAALFSFASFFLFIAVLPLVYAPETLPEKVMKDRDLKSYVEKAKKKMQAEAEKEQNAESKKSDKESEDGFIEFEFKPEEKDEYEEAQKLAEKYY